MPILTHLNNDQNSINRRIVKAMLKQVADVAPDVPPVPTDSNTNQNFMSLMKSLTNILMNLREMYWYRFGATPEGEADYEYDLPDVSDLSEASSGLSGLQSQASSVSLPFYRRGVASPASSVYSQPVSSASSLGRLSSREGLSQYSQPRRDEESIISNINYAQANSLVINSLTKEVVNAQFLVEELIFGQLSKVQKQSLKQIIVKINKVKGIINNGVAKPIYIKLNKIISRILSSLKETGEGSTTEFLLNTEQSMPPDAYNPLIGNGRKNRLLCPAMYNSHQFNPRNVNDNFCYNLAKRNI